MRSPEETMGYDGLFREVVVGDIYKLRELSFIPDLIFDIGANIGIFTRFAAELFPNAKIVSVEPHPPNFELLRDNSPPNAVLLDLALGRGKVWNPRTAANGAGECYLGEYLGYSEEFHRETNATLVAVGTVTIEELFERYWEAGMKTVVKIDCEGAENSIFDHEPSMACLRKSEYVTMEIHHYSGTALDNPKVIEATRHQLESFEGTHECTREHVLFYATKRKLG